MTCFTMNNQQTSPSSPEARSLPSSLMTLPTFNKRSIRVFWFVAGLISIITHVETLMDELQKIPWLSDFLSALYFLPLFLIGLILGYIAPLPFVYVVMVSHLMPSKPVGCHVKHGFELVALFAAVILQWFWGYDFYDLGVFSAFIAEFHAYCQFRYHSVDLSPADFILQELMQVAVYLCGKNLYAIVATTVGSLMVICYRFHSYSCPEASEQHVGFIEKLGVEKAC